MSSPIISLQEEFFRIAGEQAVLGDPTGKPAYLYTRSSDKTQAMEGRESLARQLFFAHQKAKTDGRLIMPEMVYWDVWCGKDADRPAFHQLLADVKHHKSSNLIYIDQTDRLSRNTAVYYVLLHDLTRHGLTVRFELEEDDLIRHIKLAFDELELEKRRYRQIQANRARATKGYVTSRRAAYGYKLTENGLAYVLDEHQAYWARCMFEWYVAGRSLRWIAKTLTEDGITPPLGGKCWHPESLRDMLQNEVYKGTYIANRNESVQVWEGGKQKIVHQQKPESEWISVAVPAIVSEELWAEVQRRMATNRQKSLRHARKHEWLLNGMVYCVCGHAYSCKRKKNKFKLATGEETVYTYDFYFCANPNRIVADACHQGLIAKHRLEAFVLEALEMLIGQVELWEELFEENDEQVDLFTQRVALCQKQMAELDSQMNELLEIALEQRTTSTRNLFLEKQIELEKQRRSYEEQLKIAQEHLQLAQETFNRRQMVEEILAQLQLIGGLANLPFDLQRRLLTQLVDEIVLNTKEGWFEIRGVLSEVRGMVGDKFSYRDNEQIMSISGNESPRSPRRFLHHQKACV